MPSLIDRPCRPNLKISVLSKKSMSTDLQPLVAKLRSKHTGATIVYVPTTKGTEQVAHYLSENLPGHAVVTYHGQMSHGNRERAHLDFLSNQAQVIVATLAFGMGIDKPDIRRIVHYGYAAR